MHDDTQTMITISRKVFSGWVRIQLGGLSKPSQIAIWLSRPTCGDVD